MSNPNDTVRKAVTVKHEIETRVVVDVPKDEVKNDKLLASDRTIKDIVRVTHQKMRHTINTDAAYPYFENITSIETDVEDPYDEDKDKLDR